MIRLPYIETSKKKYISVFAFLCEKKRFFGMTSLKVMLGARQESKNENRIKKTFVDLTKPLFV